MRDRDVDGPALLLVIGGADEEVLIGGAAVGAGDEVTPLSPAVLDVVAVCTCLKQDVFKGGRYGGVVCVP